MIKIFYSGESTRETPRIRLRRKDEAFSKDDYQSIVHRISDGEYIFEHYTGNIS